MVVKSQRTMLDRQLYLKRLQGQANINAQIASKINANSTNLLSVAQGQLVPGQLNPVASAPTPSVTPTTNQPF